jgi:hypothetical protein
MIYNVRKKYIKDVLYYALAIFLFLKRVYVIVSKLIRVF